jgi:tetratricopeptide (TPR) repeat protein
MSKVVRLSDHPATGFGHKRVRKRKKKSPEDYGQLTIFDTDVPSGKVVRLNAGSSFEEALTLDESGDTDAAREAYKSAIRKGDRSADAYCNLGIIESRNNSIQAIDCFTRSLRASPRHFQAHYNLANLYSEKKNYDLAKLHYEIAIEIAADFPNAHYNLGLVLALLKDYQGAIDALTTYRKLAPADDLGKTNDLINSLTRSITD